MTKFRGSIGSNQARGIAVLPGFFLGEQAVAAACTLDPVAVTAERKDREGQALVGNAAAINQPAVSDSAGCCTTQSAEDASTDRLAWAAVWCLIAAAVAAFALAVLQ